MNKREKEALKRVEESIELIEKELDILHQYIKLLGGLNKYRSKRAQPESQGVHRKVVRKEIEMDDSGESENRSV